MAGCFDGRDGHAGGQHRVLWDCVQLSVVAKTPAHQQTRVVLQDQVVDTFVGTKGLQDFQWYLREKNYRPVEIVSCRALRSINTVNDSGNSGSLFYVTADSCQIKS